MKRSNVAGKRYLEDSMLFRLSVAIERENPNTIFKCCQALEDVSELCG